MLVADVEHGGVRATVPERGRAFYRWRFVERPLAEGNASMALLLDVLPTPPTDPPSPTGPPTPTSTPSDPSDPSTPTSTPADLVRPRFSLAPGDDRVREPRSERRPSRRPPPRSASPTDATDESASPSESDSHGTR